MDHERRDDGPVTLLLIEDDLVDQMAFLRTVRELQLPYRVEIAGSIREAKNQLNAILVTIVISDFYLGDGTLYDILPDLKERGIPVILVSGSDDTRREAELLGFGICDFLIKDQNYNYLKALPMSIERALARPHKPSPNAAGPSPPPGYAATVPSPAEAADDIASRRLMVDQSELVARFRPDRTLVFVNESFCRYFGKSRSELIGKPFSLPTDSEGERQLNALIAFMIPRAPRGNFEIRIVKKDATPRWLDGSIRTLFDGSGDVIEYQFVATDITERRQAEEALKESEERYRMLAEYAFDGVMIQDFGGKILYVNNSIVRMFGYAGVEDALGKSTLSFIAPEDRATVIADMKNVLAGTEGYTSKYRAVRKDGSRIIVESIGTYISYEGKPANIIALRDITEREHAEAELKKELERKRDFINVAAHELRTPLQPIIGYLDLLIEDADKFHILPEAGEMLEKVRHYVDRERHLVNQILELSLVEEVRDRYKPSMEEVHVRKLVDLVILNGRYSSEATVTVSIPEDVTITSNGAYLHEIINELLSNAVKYSNAPRQISVSSDDTPEGFRISVADNGIGILPEKIRTIFEPFYLSDADKLSRTYGRLGLGLAMAQQRAAMLGGTISATSIPGTGSTFTLSLPPLSAVPGRR